MARALAPPFSLTWRIHRKPPRQAAPKPGPHTEDDAYNSRTGTFSNTVGTAIPGGNQFQVNYPAGKVQLEVVP